MANVDCRRDEFQTCEEDNQKFNSDVSYFGIQTHTLFQAAGDLHFVLAMAALMKAATC